MTTSIQALVDALGAIKTSKSQWEREIATQALADYHKSQKEDWISVEDSLPEYGEKVLVLGEQKGMNPQMGGAYISIGMRQDLKGTLLEKQADRHQDKNQFRQMSYVTHWMPLPKIPKINQGDVAGSQTNSIDKK